VDALRVYDQSLMRAVQPREAYPSPTTEALDSLIVRLLAVHAEDARSTPLEYRLSTAGFAVQVASLGVSALKAVHQWNPDAIILDVMQTRDGFTWIPTLRRLTQAPVIMLGAKGVASEKVTALLRGADDYVSRPFDMDELIARVHSALRRPHLAVTETLRFADLLADAARRIVVRSGRDIPLSKREFDLLLMLMRNPKTCLDPRRAARRCLGRRRTGQPSVGRHVHLVLASEDRRGV